MHLEFGYVLPHGPFCTLSYGLHMKNEQECLGILYSHFWQRWEINNSLRHVR